MLVHGVVVVAYEDGEGPPQDVDGQPRHGPNSVGRGADESSPQLGPLQGKGTVMSDTPITVPFMARKKPKYER